MGNATMAAKAKRGKVDLRREVGPGEAIVCLLTGKTTRENIKKVEKSLKSKSKKSGP